MADANALMQYDANKKSVGVAYLLWFFFGGFGGHRFYLGETGSAAALLIITLVSIALMFVVVGFFTLAISAIWVFVDLFLIPGIARKHNVNLAMQLNADPDQRTVGTSRPTAST